MKIGVIKESDQGEVPGGASAGYTVARLVKAGFEVIVENGAGISANFADSAYSAVGAALSKTANISMKLPILFSKSSLLAIARLNRLKGGGILIGFLDPLRQPWRIAKLADRGITALSMELIPRSSRAQSMDALSSQANLAGYKAVLLAAVHCRKCSR